MSQTIGEGVIKVSADASGVRAGINDAKTALQGLKEAAKSAGESLDKQSTNYIRSLERQAASLERQAATFGKSKSEIAAYNAAQLGVSATAASVVSRVDAAEKSLRAQALAAKQATDAALLLASAQGKVSISAGQTAAALRGVPAQFTDIVTSLQGGQNPLTVLLQQGGQLKDTFGGIGPAARGLGGFVAGLINPFTLAAAAAAALAAAFFEGSKESAAYQRALTLTGNFAGQTAGQMTDLARAISLNIGTQGKAADVLAQLAGTGKVAGSALQSVATAAIELERTTGVAISKTIEQFISLSDEPAKASAKLSDSLHYLSVATYERIVSLEDQGRKEEAAALAQQTYAKAVDDRTKNIQGSLGLLERAWQSVGNLAKAAWDKMLNIGRSDGTDQAIEKLQSLISNEQGKGQASFYNRGTNNALVTQMQAQLELLQTQRRESTKLADLDAERASIQQAGVAAAAKIKTAQDADLPKAQKLNKELADRKQLYDQLRASNPTSDLLKNEAQDYANIREKYKPAKAPEFRDDAATKMLQTLREQEAALNSQLDTASKLTDAEKDRAKFLQLIDDLKGKKILTSDQKSLVAAQSAIKAQLNQNVAAAQAVEIKKDQEKLDAKNLKALDDTQAKVDGIARTIEASQEGRKEQYDKTLSVFGMGSQALEQLNSTKSILREYRKYQADLTAEASRQNTLGSDQYAKGTEQIRKGLADELKLNSDYYAELKIKQADWTNGAAQAYANYIDNARNVAKQTEDAFTRAFSSLEDVFVSFVTTGKLDFKSLANSIISDLVRIQVKTALAGSGSGGGLFGSLLGLFGGGGGGKVGDYNATALLDGMRANGGSVASGGTYLIGERGPELLHVGAGGGSVTANDKIGGSAVIQNVTNNIGSNVSRQEVAQGIQAGMKSVKSDLMEYLRVNKVA